MDLIYKRNSMTIKNMEERILTNKNIKSVVCRQGPGSDGPFVQAEYYLDLVLQTDEKIQFSIYQMDDGKLKVIKRTRDDPLVWLVDELNNVLEL